MKSNAELVVKANETVDFYTELGNEIYKIDMAKPKVDSSLRGATAGQYSRNTHSIKINLVLFQENFEDYIENTLPHEVAHAVARYMYRDISRRIMPHGQEWKMVMRDFGKNPRRCHSYDTSSAQSRTVRREYSYSCGCPTPHNFTIIRHRRALNGAVYRCRKCNSPLTYDGV